MQQLGYDLYVVTNQSGVGRGYFSLESVYVVHRQFQNDMRENKLQPFKDFAICPHNPQDLCQCRKPSGKMILDLIEAQGLTSEECYMVGDKIIDAEAGKNAGIKGVMVRNNQKTEYPYFKTLYDFAVSLKK
jgi:D-glycero-D-manno-heptose 1,7-bisphosphate phosphatase